jgi:hypothetical protein
MNKLTMEQYLLTCLAEEAAEISEESAKLVKLATKALRFGLDEVQEGQDKTNIERIVGVLGLMCYELNDLIAILEELGYDNLVFQQIGDREAIEAKKKKLDKYMVISKARGIV